MKDTQRVCRLQSVGNLDSHREHKLQAGRPGCDQFVQRLARHKLHGDVSLVAALTHLVNRAHIRMLDGRSQPRLAQHRRPHLLGGQQPGVQHLKHDGPLQKGVVGRVHHTAAASAQTPQNLVMGNCLSLHRSIQV